MRKEREPEQDTYPDEDMPDGVPGGAGQAAQASRGGAGKGREAERQATTVNAPKHSQARSQT